MAYKKTAFVMLWLLISALVGCGSEPAERSVLFVGNSFTFGNEVPHLVEEIAAENGSSIDTSMIATGGRFLDEHLNDPAVVTALQSGDYDIVVLQEQSMAPADPATFQNRTLPAARALDSIADASGTDVVLYQTWGHLRGNELINQPNYTSMQDALIASYDQLSGETGAPVARVGEAWQRYLPLGTGVSLHAEDGVHASEAGSYLAALVLATWVSTEPIAEAPALGAVDAELAAELRNSMW